jgi:hypothetical protein
MANITFSSPFIRGFIHQDSIANIAASTLLAAATTPERRVIVIIQNKSSTASVDVILASTGTAGIILRPFESLRLENYNGIIRADATADATPVHIAYAVC